MRTLSLALTLAASALATPVGQAATDVTLPKDIVLPQVEPLVPACADPAADHFLEVDISQRPPAGATRVQRISAWVTPDGIFHWPFVMRVRNLGDQPFIGKTSGQAAVITLDDLTANKKGQVLTNVPFDRIAQHSGVAVRFEFTAPADQVSKGKFHRIYTLALKYKNEGVELIAGRNGDCNLRNNSFAIEFDASRKGWIFAK